MKNKTTKKNRILTQMGLAMILIGGISGLFYIAAIVLVYYQPEMFAETCRPYMEHVTSADGISPEYMYRKIIWIRSGFYLLQSLLLFRNGIHTFNWVGRPDKAGKLIRRGIFVVIVAAAGLVSGIWHGDEKAISNGVITELINALYLTGAFMNLRRIRTELQAETGKNESD